MSNNREWYLYLIMVTLCDKSRGERPRKTARARARGREKGPKSVAPSASTNTERVERRGNNSDVLLSSRLRVCVCVAMLCTRRTAAQLCGLSFFLLGSLFDWSCVDKKHAENSLKKNPNYPKQTYISVRKK